METPTKEQLEQKMQKLSDEDLQAVSGGTLPDSDLDKFYQELTARRQRHERKDDPEVPAKEVTPKEYLEGGYHSVTSYLRDQITKKK